MPTQHVIESQNGSGRAARAINELAEENAHDTIAQEMESDQRDIECIARAALPVSGARSTQI